jgi:hypothetical protein
MTNFQISLLLIFGIIFYMVIVDQNVADFINLLAKVFKNEVSKRIWMIKYHPRNPITNLIKRREYAKIAEELIKEYNIKE